LQQGGLSLSTNVTAKKANSEQESAIYHKGGKLLSAGAGSGKTFVLIEHLIYLLSEVKTTAPREEWNRRLSSVLSKMVLMTFTKKAAGEMSVRMMKKVEDLIAGSLDEGDLLFWSTVRQNLSILNITTIHGFCHKLLSLGFWAEFPQQINLVSEIEQKEKIQKLFDRWFELKSKNLDPVFLAGSQALLSAMKDIFSSPELRVLWSGPYIPQSAEEEINRFFKEFVHLKGYGEFFEESFDLQADVKEAKKKWYELFILFNELKMAQGEINADNFRMYHQFFSSIARMPPASKEMSVAQIEAWEIIKALKADLKLFAEDLIALTENFATYKSWVQIIAEVFSYIDSHYFDVEGFSFADLEYYTLKALQKEEVLQKVREGFTYFIVDEFQDTSFIQFEILKNLIGADMNRLFCVGDRKQAIYGFRGGELQVFADCAEMLGEENNYFLKNNFRSFCSIIQYNNTLFEKVFPLGPKYSGHDPHSVEMEAQNVPENKTESGVVVALKTLVTGDTKDPDLDKVEAEILCRHIMELMKEDQYQSICVLYRKLKPSAYLLEQFLKNDIPFNAQVKIDFSEDPVIVLFLYMVELVLHKGDPKKEKSTLILVRSLLEILGVDFSDSALKQFHADVSLFGLRIAFHKFLFSLGFSNSFYSQNSSLVDSICRLAKEDVTAVYNLIKGEDDGQYACEMMSGAVEIGKKRILVMSAHASKGLEFDAVLLGGVHTNGRYQGMKAHIGKLPHSFKWKREFSQKIFFKSPYYHIESEILKLKDFSESKRLLYVACTRAVKQLAYADLYFDKNGEMKDLYEFDNSWIQALRLIPVQSIQETYQHEEEREAERSLIQQDSLGLVAHQSSAHLGIIAELSVTRLATIAECPYKFYLQNICKIEVSEQPSSLFADEEEVVFYSSMKRGTEVHAYLSRLFTGQITADQLPGIEKEKMLWVWDLARELICNSKIISELPIKFSLFGQMISGTPDLVFLSDEKIIIWDFKTGLRDDDGEEAYWFQLLCYAYAYGIMNKLGQETMVELALLYLDQKECIKQSLSLNQMTQLLFSHWKKTESLNQINSAHCSRCEYSSICRKGQTSASP